MPAAKDITGQRFGRLVAIRPIKGKLGKRQRQWFCLCDCGNANTLNTNVLLSGISRSCGCFQIEARIDNNTTHDQSKTSEYSAWQNMKRRCDNVSSRSYPNYGGRGIAYDARWSIFENFIADLGPKPTRAHTLERINNELHYGPTNCVWETRKVQARNRRTSKLFTHQGQTRCLAEWERELNLPLHSIGTRMRRGYTFEQAISHKPYQKRITR